MIGYLEGEVILLRENIAIVSVHGVGYRVNINSRMKISYGDNVVLFIHHHIRETAQELYGFGSFEELSLFEKLISVNGVGPKVAMSIMGADSSEAILKAILQGNTDFFSAISGIGKKVAAKIILELKSKLAGIDSISDMNYSSDSEEVIEALIGLGYKKFEIVKVLGRLPAEVTNIEDKVRWTLKHLVK